MPRGPALEGLAIAILVFVALTATAHLWGPVLGRLVKRIWRNLNVAAATIGRGVARVLGQGQTRPTGPHDGE